MTYWVAFMDKQIEVSVNERALNSTSAATTLLSSLQVEILKQEVLKYDPQP